jgi:tetratricopeptide (TPR) repeat protein
VGSTPTIVLLGTLALLAPAASAAPAPAFPSTSAPAAVSPAATERQLRGAVAQHPKNPVAHEELGSFLLEQRRPLDAIPPLHEALRLQPERFLARINLGNAIAALGLRDEARAVFQELLRRNPGRIEVCRRLADLALETGQPEEALRILRTGRGLDQSPEALVVLGQIYQAQGKPDEARAAYESSRRLMARNPDAYYRLGRLFMADRRYSDAKQAFMATTFWDPQRADAHYQLGMAALATKDLAGARAAFQAALKASTGYGPAVLQLRLLDRKDEKRTGSMAARLQTRPLARPTPATARHTGFPAELRRRADAARAAKQADLADLWSRLARAAEMRGREELQLRQSLRRRPNDATARLALARFLIRQGELREARGHLQEAIRRSPGSTEAKPLLTELDRVLAALE